MEATSLAARATGGTLNLGTGHEPAPLAGKLVDPAGRLSGVLWPIRITPQPDELLSSWIYRLAAPYALAPCDFLRAIGIEPGRLPTDLDRAPSDELLDLLAERTGTARARVEAMRLGIELREWQLRAAGDDRETSVPTALYCPSCLAADEMPYIRRAWRLACVTLCVRHARPLMDRCVACGTALMLPGLDPTSCDRCGHDRRRSDTVHRVQAIEVAGQRCIDRALAGEEIVVSTIGPIQPARYLDYVHTLVRLIVGGSSARVLWPELCVRYQLPYPRPDGRGLPAVRQMDIENRRRAITLVTQVLADWPVGFAETLLALDLWGSEHVWRGEDPLWSAVRTHYEANGLAACPPSFRPRRPYSSSWQL